MPRLGMCLNNLNYLQNKTSRVNHIRVSNVVRTRRLTFSASSSLYMLSLILKLSFCCICLNLSEYILNIMLNITII